MRGRKTFYHYWWLLSKIFEAKLLKSGNFRPAAGIFLVFLIYDNFPELFDGLKVNHR